MKIDINILPYGEREKLKEEKKIGFALKLAFSFVAVLLFTNAVLFLMQMVLGIEYQAAKYSSEKSAVKNTEKEDQLERTFEDTNKQVANFSRIGSGIPNWARVLVRVSELCPDGIRISRLSAEENQIEIAGFAKTRDDFLDFQNSLKAEGFQFSSDISNLVASRDFNFDLSVGISQDYLIRK